MKPTITYQISQLQKTEEKIEHLSKTLAKNIFVDNCSYEIVDEKRKELCDLIHAVKERYETLFAAGIASSANRAFHDIYSDVNDWIEIKYKQQKG